MNKLSTTQYSVMLAARHFLHICFNMDEYIGMALSGKDFERYLDMYLDNESISKGLFCRIFGANIWVSNIVNDGCIRVSNRGNPSITNEMDWSPNLELEDFPKLLELKAFW